MTDNQKDLAYYLLVIFISFVVFAFGIYPHKSG